MRKACDFSSILFKLNFNYVHIFSKPSINSRLRHVFPERSCLRWSTIAEQHISFLTGGIMAALGGTKIKEAFGVIILAVILVPIADSLAQSANLTSTTRTVVLLLPLLLGLLAVLFIIGVF
jgi:hypothetical protein